MADVEPAPGHVKRVIALLLWGLLIFAIAWWTGRRAAGVPSPVSRAYDVRDLVTAIPDATNAPRLGLPPRQPNPPTTAPTTTQLTGDRLVDLIRRTAAPQSWGRRPLAVSHLAGRIVVTQTPDVHAQIQDLLRDLRRSRETQIQVSARFLSVEDSVVAALPEDLRTQLTSGAALSDADVNRLLEAFQRHHGTTTITAPRVTVLNGQRAYVLVSNQTPYVSSINVDPTAVAANRITPVTSVAESGVLLDVRATVGDDESGSVLLSIRQEVAHLVSLETTTPTKLADGTELTIQQPTAARRVLDTAVSVPDGKTKLLTGFAREITTDPTVTQPKLPQPPATALLLVRATVLRPTPDRDARIFPKP